MRIFALLLHCDHLIVQGQIHIGTEIPPDKGLRQRKTEYWGEICHYNSRSPKRAEAIARTRHNTAQTTINNAP